jgi:hypothetical protein
MPNQLKAGMTRTSYVEKKATDTALGLLASVKSTNKSDLIRQATKAYIEKEDPEGKLRDLAEHLSKMLPDERRERANAEIDQETMQEVALFFKKLKSSR